MGKTWHHGRYNWRKSPKDKKRFQHILYDNVWWTCKEPKWWRKIFKHRKRRAELKRRLTLLRKGADPEDMVWPLDGKPWEYYW